MKVASFEPVVGGAYEFQDMTVIHQGIFRGFIRNVCKSTVKLSNGDRAIYPAQGDPLLLFEIMRQPGEAGYRYAGVRARVYYNVVMGRVDLMLVADHFGSTVAGIDRHGPQAKRFWKLVESSGE